jgi:hypothetical protein
MMRRVGCEERLALALGLGLDVAFSLAVVERRDRIASVDLAHRHLVGRRADQG